MESFDIKVKKTRKVKNEEYFTDEETDEGSDISEDEIEKYEGDDEHEEFLTFFRNFSQGKRVLTQTNRCSNQSIFLEVNPLLGFNNIRNQNSNGI